ncbi:MAG: MFS transporter [Thermoplasmata archaeon]|nr:MFS transporter [Thermoplasmata archaeon]
MAQTPARPERGAGRTSSYRALLGRDSLRRFILAGAFAFAAPTAVLVALIWAMATAYPGLPPSQQVEYGALSLALIGLSATIPTLLSAVFSGTLADRVERRRLMLVVSLVSLAATFGLMVDLTVSPSSHVGLPGVAGYYLPLWAIPVFPLWATITTATTIYRPAFNASLPRLVSTAELGTANGLVYASAIAVSVVATLLTPALFPYVGVGLALGVPLLLFLFGALYLVLLDENLSPARTGEPRRFLPEALEGYRYLWRRKALLEITLAALLINFFSAVAFVELGLYVRTWLNLGTGLYVGALLAGASLGSGAGTLLIARFRFERHAGRYLIALTAFQGLAVLGLAFVHTVWLALPDMFLFGVLPGMFMTVFLSTVQATVPNEKLGRVLAADEVGSYALVPIGQYVGGLLTLAGGIQVTYIIAGLGTTTIGVLMLGFRELRRLGFDPQHPPPERAEPTSSLRSVGTEPLATDA